MEIIDLSFCIDEDCMTCGTPWHVKVELKQLGKISEVGRNTHSIFLGSHTGTHMDAPKHFYDDGFGIDKADLNKICGECRVLDLSYITKGGIVSKRDLEGRINSNRIIFRFNWFKHWHHDDYYKDFPFFSIEAAEYLLECGVSVIALDTPSPDSGNAIGELDDSPVHKLFLKSGVTIIEYLNNTDKLDVDKAYNLFALPLKLKECDGSPARVIVTEVF